MDGKEAIEQFKEWYFESYGVKPTEKLIETFCKMKGIDIEKIREQARKEVANVEEIKVCSVLADAPTVASDSAQLVQAKEPDKDELISILNTITGHIQTVMKMFEPYRHLLNHIDSDELRDIEEYMEGLRNENGTNIESFKQT